MFENRFRNRLVLREATLLHQNQRTKSNFFHSTNTRLLIKLNKIRIKIKKIYEETYKNEHVQEWVEKLV